MGVVTAVDPVPAYREWNARPALRRYVRCAWVGAGGGRGAEPVLPDGCMDVIWNGVHLFVAGPDTAPVQDAHGGPFAVGIRFRPGAAPLFLGLPAATLRDRRVDLEHLWPSARRLADQLDRACGGGRPMTAGAIVAVTEALQEMVASRIEPGHVPDPVVEQASRRWSTDPLALPVSRLARETELTERQLHRRFLRAAGYGPKRLQRILRFQTFLQRSGEVRCGLAELAVLCGYADQAHLSRETALLAGRTPAQLVAARAGMSDSSKTDGDAAL